MRAVARSKAVAQFISVALGLCAGTPAFAIDSYRYLHVSIETPWMIFLFLLVAVFVPFVLLVGLMWWHPKIRAVTKASKQRGDSP